MITGQVTAQLEAQINLYVEDDSGQSYPMEATIDTGFSGFLTLPLAVIANLSLPWVTQRLFMLADGSTILLEVFSAVIIWDGQPRRIDVHGVNTDPVVGMKMLAGHELRIRVVDGGLVWIDLVP